jgi:N-acetylglucosamine kinase-like BadF-type ATPase
MTQLFLGVDVGSSKTHALIADSHGQALGFGVGGPGNHESVGYEGLTKALNTAVAQAVAQAGILRERIAGAGFGVAGLDWPVEKPPTLAAIATLNLTAPLEAVNDTIIGLLAGSSEGWGIAVVSGTGCNCRGWTRDRRREGMVTGAGVWMGEGAGATELIARALHAIAHEWTRRGPVTQLSPVLVKHAGARDLTDLLEGLMDRRYRLGPNAAPLVFEVAAAGDPVAREVVDWAGCELGEMVNAVARQLEIESESFDVVMVGSMFRSGELLIGPMRQTILSFAPGARLLPLASPPVVGAVLLGMGQAGFKPSPEVREALNQSARAASQI